MKKSVRDFLTAHWGAFCVAFVVGLLSGLPSVLAVQALGDDYRGMPFLYQDNDVTYLTRAHEIADGNIELSSPFLHEYKDGGQSLMPAVGEWLYVPFLHSVTVTKFLFPAVLFLLIYTFAFLLLSVHRRLAAISAASLGTLGFALVFPSEVLSLFTSDELYLSIWTRLVHPISGGILLFGFLISLLLSVRRNWWWALPAALCLGLSTGYIFAFGIACVVLGILTLILMNEGRFHELYAVVGIGVGGLLLNIPHFISALSRGVGGGSAETLKAGMLFTHHPLFSLALTAAVVFVCGVVYYLYLKKEKLSAESGVVFSLVTLLACIVAMNQQILTGRTAWPQHFIQYAVPLIYVALVVCVVTVRAIPEWIQKAILIGGIGASLLIGLVTLPTYRAVLDDYKTVNRYSGALAYIDAHDGPCVAQPVERSEHMNSFITAFTHCDVYLTHYVFMGVPEERIMHNFLVYMRLMGVTPQTAETFLKENRKKIWAVFFRDWRDIFHDTRDPWLLAQSDYDETEAWLDTISADILSRYQDAYTTDFRTQLRAFKIDYLVWDREGGTQFDATRYPFIKPAFEADSVVVYRVE